MKIPCFLPLYLFTHATVVSTQANVCFKEVAVACENKCSGEKHRRLFFELIYYVKMARTKSISVFTLKWQLNHNHCFYYCNVTKALNI